MVHLDWKSLIQQADISLNKHFYLLKKSVWLFHSVLNECLNEHFKLDLKNVLLMDKDDLLKSQVFGLNISCTVSF